MIVGKLKISKKKQYVFLVWKWKEKIFLNQQVPMSRTDLTSEDMIIHNEDILCFKCSELTLWLRFILSHFNFIETSVIKQSSRAALWTVLFENVTVPLKLAKNMGEGATCLSHGQLWIATLSRLNSAST